MAGSEVFKRCASRPAEEDRSQRTVLGVVGCVVNIQADPPRRSRFIVVVPPSQDYGKIAEDDVVRPALSDVPGKGELTDAECGATAGTVAYGAARADGVAVARLEVAAPQVP